MFYGKFDVNSFFKNGHYVGKLDDNTSDYLLNLIEKEKFAQAEQKNLFLDNPDHPDAKLEYPEIWTENGSIVQAFSRQNYNPDLVQFWKEFSDINLKWFKDSFGSFDDMTMLAHNFKINNEIGFHTDYIEASYLGVIVYLGDRNFTKDDGGYLELAKCKVDNDGTPIIETVLVLNQILPNHGTVVFISNTNPCFMHRVVPLKYNKKRVSHACRFGFITNRLSKKNLPNHGYL